MKKILVSSFHYYNWHRRVGIHYFADYFIKKGFTCLWITLPYTPIHLFSRAFRSEKLSYARIFSKKPILVSPNVYNSTCFSLTYPKKGLPRWSYKNFLFFSNLKRHIQILNFFKPDIFLVESGYGFDILKYIQPKERILRVSDDLAAINFPEYVLEKEKEAINNYTLTTTLNSELKKTLVLRGAKSENIFLIDNGIDISKFDSNIVIPKNVTPICVYVGVIDLNHFDIESIVEVAKKSKNIKFHIYGPVNQNIRIKLPDNIILFGKISFDKVPSILKRADCGIIPFKNNPRMKTTIRPLKYYQYLISGLPVVFRDVGKMSALKNCVGAFSYNNIESMQTAIYKAIESGKKMENRNKYHEYAKKYSWDNRLNEFSKLLKDKG